MPRLTEENIVRCFAYNPPDEERAKAHHAINSLTTKLALVYFQNCPGSPELQLAVRKLQEARMWANAAIATNEPTEQTPAPAVTES